MNVARVLRESAEKHPERIAVDCMGGRTSYRELDRAADGIAHALRRMGIGKGERVGLYCINSPHFVAGYFGILKAGAVAVPINLLLHPKEVGFILRDSGSRALIFHELFADAVASIRGDLPGLTAFIVAGRTTSLPATPYDDVMSEMPDEAVEAEMDEEDVAAILYTSGTTGNPKGAMLTHRNLLSNSSSVAYSLGITHDDIVLAVLPMFHSFAMTCCMITPIRQAARIVALPKFDPGMVGDAVKASRATLFFGVPSMYILLLQLPDNRTEDFRSIRYAISGGAAMPKEVMLAFERRYGFFIYEGDGPTECSPVTTVNPIGGRRKVGSIGLPIRDVELKIVDDEGRDLPDGAIGEIVVRGPNVMKGYHEQPEATREAFFGEWFRTGDLGERDSEGYFCIVDRKKDMIIVGGMNVYPRHVEEVLHEHPAVAEAAVVGAPHRLSGEMVVAYVVPKPGCSVTGPEIRRFCLQSLGRFQVPRRVVIRESLPKSGTGKILKRELRKQGEIDRGVVFEDTMDPDVE